MMDANKKAKQRTMKKFSDISKEREKPISLPCSKKEIELKREKRLYRQQEKKYEKAILAQKEKQQELQKKCHDIKLQIRSLEESKYFGGNCRFICDKIKKLWIQLEKIEDNVQIADWEIDELESRKAGVLRDKTVIQEQLELQITGTKLPNINASQRTKSTKKKSLRTESVGKEGRVPDKLPRLVRRPGSSDDAVK